MVSPWLRKPEKPLTRRLCRHLLPQGEKGRNAMLWIPITVAAAAFQVARNAAQRSLLGGGGPWGATLVRFLFGLPFSLVISTVALLLFETNLKITPVTLAWAALCGAMQLGATAALLTAMQRSSFALGTAFQQSGLPFAAILGLLFFGAHLSAAGWGGGLLASAGLVILSWPRDGDVARDWTAAALGTPSRFCFAVSGHAFRQSAL